MSIKLFLAGAALALGMTCGAISASAGTIDWTLSGVIFADGGAAAGTFSSDDKTGAVLAFDIATTGGSALPGFHYDDATSIDLASFGPNSFSVGANTPLNSPAINLSFANPLTSPGSDALDLSFSYECDQYYPASRATAGEAMLFTPVGAPEPAVWAMLILGVGMVGLAVRRRTARVTLAA